MPFRAVKSFSRWWQRSVDGVAAIEFAFCAPLLVLLLLGCMEVATMLMADRKVTSSTTAMVDLAARFDEMVEADLDNIFTAGKIIMEASSTNAARARLTSIRLDSGQQAVVDWSVKCGQYSKLQPGNSINDLPAGLIEGSQTILMIETEYEFDSLFDFLIPGSRTLSDTFYQRPRTAEQIELKFPSASYSCPW